MLKFEKKRLIVGYLKLKVLSFSKFFRGLEGDIQTLFIISIGYTYPAVVEVPVSFLEAAVRR